MLSISRTDGGVQAWNTRAWRRVFKLVTYLCQTSHRVNYGYSVVQILLAQVHVMHVSFSILPWS